MVALLIAPQAWALAVIGAMWVYVGMRAAILWVTRDRTPDSELCPLVFADSVLVKVRRRRRRSFGRYGLLAIPEARVRLLVGRTVIATRTGETPRWVGVLIGVDHTLDAADLRVDVVHRDGLLGRFGSYLAVRGPYKRGWVELAIRGPRKSNLEDVRHALVLAGAQPGLEEIKR